ncbi:Ig-like domain-containing protein [Paraglaciecola aquimarina]|uniref:Ig-like domain-containing protein n=1 Tax=Paraglaciecola aquimarina TaxID=1235557 RepID=A0ABU3SRF8_9ALTE|nr:Ig-like domain-containing protein [Paraglaciecola aquimarina]MDU0352578.1 Ig-like domain-containing protein [Paraglaciecola aquimarina]
MTGDLADRNNFAALTYPKFFETKDGTLLLYMRWGGNNNGAYYFNRYDADQQKWSTFTPFNHKNQKTTHGNAYNWGLYGNMKYVNGKLRVGFQQRSNNNTDKYIYQNGVFYAYSDHPEGFGAWKNHKGEEMTWPLVNSDEIKVFEPGDYITHTEPNSVHIVGSFDWTVTAKGDIHTISLVRSTDRSRPDYEQQYIHAYKPAGADEFIIDTDFVGASNIYTSGDNIYIIGLKNGRPFVEKAVGGTSDFERVYEETEGPVFDHGTIYVKDGKVYYYLMEKTSGNAMPLHLQIIDLDLESDAAKPVVSFPQTSMTAFEGYEQLSFKVDAISPVGRTVTQVDLYVDGNFIRTDSAAPFVWGHNNKPTELLGLPVGTHTFRAIATDSEGATSFASMSFEVKSTRPIVSFPKEVMTVSEGYEKLAITIAAEPAVEGRTIESVTLYINDELVRVDDRPTYLFGHGSKPHETGAMGWEEAHGVNPNPLLAGEHTFKAIALDSAGQTSTTTMTLIVESNAPSVAFPQSAMTVDEGYEKLAITVAAEATGDRTIESVTLYINGELVRVDNSYTYLFGHASKPHETGAMGWTESHTPNPNPFTAGEYIFTAVALDSAGAESETSMTLTVRSAPKPPTISFPNDVVTVVEGYQKLAITLNAAASTEGGEIKSVTLYRNGDLVRVDTRPVWNFGHSHAPYEFGAMGWIDCNQDPVPKPCHEPNPNPLGVGEHTFTAVAVDDAGLKAEASMTLIVEEPPAPTITFNESNIKLVEGYNALSVSVDIDTATESITIVSVGLYLDEVLIRELYEAPYTWGNEFNADELLHIEAGNHIFKAVVTDSNNKMSEATIIFDVEGAAAISGDWDGDGDVDMIDVRALTSAIQARQDIDLAFDMNNDGVVNVLDARMLMSVCTRTRCAVQ